MRFANISEPIRSGIFLWKGCLTRSISKKPTPAMLAGQVITLLLLRREWPLKPVTPVSAQFDLCTPFFSTLCYDFHSFPADHDLRNCVIFAHFVYFSCKTSS